jgi:hypothetical protein
MKGSYPIGFVGRGAAASPRYRTEAGTEQKCYLLSTDSSVLATPLIEVRGFDMVTQATIWYLILLEQIHAGSAGRLD